MGLGSSVQGHCAYCGKLDTLELLPIGELCGNCKMQKLDWNLEHFPRTDNAAPREYLVARTAISTENPQGACSVCHIGTANPAHDLVTSPHTQQGVECRRYGFQRVFEDITWKLSEASTREMLQHYAAIYTHGIGRWEEAVSPVDGIMTYAVRSCIAACIVDSELGPSRCSLIHAPPDTTAISAWSARIRQEISWVRASSAPAGSVAIFVSKGLSWRFSIETLVEHELRRELTNVFLPRLSEMLDSDVPIYLMHEPLWCGAIAVGRDGIFAPVVPHLPQYGAFAQEMPIVELVHRHNAFCMYKELNANCFEDFDLQYDVSGHKAVSLKPLTDIVARLAARYSTNLEEMPHKPLIRSGAVSVW